MQPQEVEQAPEGGEGPGIQHQEIMVDEPGGQCHHRLLIRGRQKGQSQQEMAEAEMGVKWPQAREHRQPLDNGKTMAREKHISAATFLLALKGDATWEQLSQHHETSADASSNWGEALVEHTVPACEDLALSSLPPVESVVSSGNESQRRATRMVKRPQVGMGPCCTVRTPMNADGSSKKVNKFRALKDDASGDRDQNEEKSAEKDGEKETSEWDESQSGSKRKAVVPGPESIPCISCPLPLCTHSWRLTLARPPPACQSCHLRAVGTANVCASRKSFLSETAHPLGHAGFAEAT
ncbi:Eukaryotic translation initiation factor 4E type 2 [Camelus dromedarius]|uniref:Eukaryotic translation initiation factor 4E type 2 n=1 Tax=Camelus dromedarius TaxID=9838 RepID=A0A5N4DE36_CAMDR|nr:Eukaryotic translation initiation factor 4E type 2 [Camelus dromedarius]